MKYLGFKIDNKLSCIEHTKYCYDKALKVFNALRGISRNNWGLSSYAMKTIYSGAIEPILTYRAQVWGEAINKIHIRCKFISIQRIAAISICKSYRTTPTNSLLVMANIIPIHLKIMKMVWMDRILNTDWNPNSLVNNLPPQCSNLVNILKKNGVDWEIKELNLHPSEPYQISIDFNVPENSSDYQIFQMAQNQDLTLELLLWF